jgi:ribosomal protein S6--L-glutamate ligase
MNIGIINRKENESVLFLKEAAEKRGHNFFVLDSVLLDISNTDNIDLPEMDAVYYWSGAGTVGRSCLLDYLKNKGVKIFNSAFLKDSLFVNKIYQTYRVAQNNVLTPKTIIKSNAKYKDISEKFDGPFILKSGLGSCGERVFLIKDRKDFIEAKKSLKGFEILYQELIPNDGDYRIHVVGGEAVCAYRRVPKEGNFKANVTLGGNMEEIKDEKLISRLYDIAEKVADSFDGADMVGIDLIKNTENDDIYFIELNEIPGIKKIYDVTGISVANKMVDFFESELEIDK